MRLVIGVLVLVLASCGFTQTRGPDSRRPSHQRPICTEIYDAPKRDRYGAVAGFVTLLVGALLYNLGDDGGIGPPLIVGGALLMGGSYASGGVGYFRVKRCRKAIEAFEHQRRAQPPSQPTHQ